MLTFNPGPSKIPEFTKKNIVNAVNKNILEISHRSEQFTQISKDAIQGLKKYFNIPKDYKIFYTSSATQAMELSILNCCQKKSFHFVNGAFSEKFLKIAQLLNKQAASTKPDLGEIHEYNENAVKKADFITITQNETSTGYACPMSDIKKIRKQNPKAILTVDITSSAGAAETNIKQADIWLFSVQKCFGLPAGLGIIIVSPNAFKKSLKHSTAGISSFNEMDKKMKEKYQTIQTPNVLNIYLLAKTLKEWNKNGGLKNIINKTNAKYSTLEKMINESNDLDFFIKNDKYRSKTVICIEAKEQIIKQIHKKAKQNNIVLGKGYGKIKPTTFRIANFPAIIMNNIKILSKILF